MPFTIKDQKPVVLQVPARRRQCPDGARCGRSLVFINHSTIAYTIRDTHDAGRQLELIKNLRALPVRHRFGQRPLLVGLDNVPPPPLDAHDTGCDLQLRVQIQCQLVPA
jgi:hypothetical protein